MAKLKDFNSLQEFKTFIGSDEFSAPDISTINHKDSQYMPLNVLSLINKKMLLPHENNFKCFLNTNNNGKLNVYYKKTTDTNFSKMYTNDLEYYSGYTQNINEYTVNTVNSLLDDESNMTYVVSGRNDNDTSITIYKEIKQYGLITLEGGTFDSTGGSINVQLKTASENEWKITNIPSWLTFSQTTGQGTTNITVTADKYALQTDRTVNVILYYKNTYYNNLSNNFIQKAQEKPDYSKQYLTFKITKDGSISNQQNYTFYYSKDNGETWQVYSDEGFRVVSGDVILFKMNYENYDHLFYESTAGFEVYGNILSLIYGDDFIGKTEISPTAFMGLFRNCTGLTSAENLILPATALTDYCYNEMFKGCTSLVNAPALPATTLAISCYDGMFRGCTSLVSAPELPATTLSDYCYSQMFQDCTSLVNVPELPATTLTNNCCSEMFENCTSLVTAPALPATTLTGDCYSYMFNGCTSLNYIKCLAENNITTANNLVWVNGVSSSGTFVKKSGVNWPTGVSGIPNNWTVEEV